VKSGTDAEQAVVEVLSALTVAWNDHDATEYARLFAPDATYVTRSGVLWRGRPAIEEGHAEAFVGPLADATVTLVPTDVIVVAPAVVVVHAAISLRAGEEPLKALTTFVLVENQGEWRIQTAHTTEISTIN
jgi:uncharacterized protein (TIGR02246 family)